MRFIKDGTVVKVIVELSVAELEWIKRQASIAPEAEHKDVEEVRKGIMWGIKSIFDKLG